MKNSIITLITDFGLEDEYVGLMKGVILGINPNAEIIDISHFISPQDIKWASYFLYYSYKYFPKGTIHVVVVDPGVGSGRRIICVKADGHIFLCPDNGVITKVIENITPEGISIVNNEKYFLKNVSDTFHGRDIFAPVAAYLSIGRAYTSVGSKIEDIKRIGLPDINQISDSIKGEVIHIDRFGNIVTNIEKSRIDEFKKQNRDIIIKIADKKIEGISKSYQEVEKGELLSIIGSRGLLEIAVNNGNAADILDINKGKEVKMYI